MIQEKPLVAFYLYSLQLGGIQRFMLNLMNSFINQGIRVNLVVHYLEGEFLFNVPESVTIVNFNSNYKVGLFKLISYLHKEKPLALISGHFPNNEIAILAKYLGNFPTKIIVTIHGMFSRHKYKFFWRLFFLGTRLFYHFADEIVAVSHAVAEDISRLISMDITRVKVIYNPIINEELFVKSQVYLDHVWFKDGQPPVILAVGRLHEEKNFSFLIHTFAEVRKKRLAKLMILGEGEERQNLQNLIVELNLEADVLMLGFVRNPYHYIAKAAVLALSSNYEALPSVIIEAMALNTPIVTTNCPGGVAEMLDYGKYGNLVPLHDTHAFAEAILQVLSGNRKCISQVWLEQFSFDTATAKYLKILTNLKVI